jgi:integral membrane protein
VGRLRVVGAIEGTSTLLLFGVAMPLKYFAGYPLAVSVAGMLHGVLFVWLCAEIGRAVLMKGWPVARGAVALVAAIVPTGPFVIDRWLAREQARWASRGESQDCPPGDSGR